MMSIILNYFTLNVVMVTIFNLLLYEFINEFIFLIQNVLKHVSNACIHKIIINFGMRINSCRSIERGLVGVV